MGDPGHPDQKTVFVSYRSDDADWANWIAWQIEELGHRVIIQSWDFAPGNNFVVEMDRALRASDVVVAVLTAGYLDSVFGLAEWASAFSEDPTGEARRLIPVRVSRVDLSALLRTIVYLDLVGRNAEDSKELLSTALSGRRAKPDTPPPFPGGALQRDSANPAFPGTSGAESDSPFRGLESFTHDDRDVFYGRASESAALYERLLEHSSAVVVGPSGVGKSSLVAAGLDANRLSRRGDVNRVVFRPGVDPYQSLAAALASSGMSRAPVPVLDVLESMKREGIRSTVDELFGEPGRECVIVADQFEEVFTSEDGAEARSFAQQFLELMDNQPLSIVAVVIVMRSDFMNDLLQLPGAGSHIQNRLFPLSPMNQQNLFDVVTGPLSAIGVEIEEGLVDALVRDVGHDVGSLPLLEFTLTQLWASRAGNRLTHSAYNRLGSANGVVGRHAEDAFAKLRSSGFSQRETASALLRMLQLRGGDVWVRREVSMSDFDTRAAEILGELAKARLVVLSAEPSGRVVAKIAHEFIVDAWPRLRVWLEDEKEFIQWRSKMEDFIGAGGVQLSVLAAAEAKKWALSPGRDISPSILDVIARANVSHDSVIAENHWWIKNALQTISSILSLQARRAGGVTFVDEVSSAIERVRVLALSNEALSRNLASHEIGAESEYPMVNLLSFAQDVVYPHVRMAEMLSGRKPDAFKITVVGDEELWLKTPYAMPFALVIFELVSNSLSHGFSQERKNADLPVLEISLGVDDATHGRSATVEVVDFGAEPGSRVELPFVERLGLSICREVVAQLGGELVLAASGDGLAVQFSVALERREADELPRGLVHRAKPDPVVQRARVEQEG